MLALVQNILTFLNLVLMIAVCAMQLWNEVERKNGKPPI